MKTSTLRLRRIRFKDGRGTIEVFNSRTKEQDRVDVEYYVRQTLDAHDDRIAGFAFVVWTPAGASVAEMKCWTGSMITQLQAPDFVRERLMIELHDNWLNRP